MTRTSVDMSPERNLIINLLTDDDFCKQIYPILHSKYLKAKYSKIIFEWVSDYYKKYECAPGKAIQDIFYQRKDSLLEDDAESISEFLVSLSREDEDKTDYNLKFELDKAERFIKIRSLEMLKDTIENAIVSGEPVKGESAIANFAQVGRPESNAVSIMSDNMEIANAFMEENEYMFQWPRGLGKVLPKPMRGDLIAFLGPPKSGKSWALDFSAGLAMEAGHRVVFVSLEMRKTQLIRRAWQRMTSSPRFGCKIMKPFFKPCFDEEADVLDEDKKWEIYLKEEDRAGVDLTSIEDYQKRKKLMYRGGDCRYLAVPAYSATVEDIIAQLDNMQYYEGYTPSVLVIDYADIMKPSKDASREYRHQIDDIWKKLRALAQARNILIITASQGNKASISGDVTAESIAEDVRKLNHVSVMISLNRKKDDKQKSLIRISSLLQRDEEECLEEAIVLQCLKIGRFHLDSKVASEVEYSRD